MPANTGGVSDVVDRLEIAQHFRGIHAPLPQLFLYHRQIGSDEIKIEHGIVQCIGNQPIAASARCRPAS